MLRKPPGKKLLIPLCKQEKHNLLTWLWTTLLTALNFPYLSTPIINLYQFDQDNHQLPPNNTSLHKDTPPQEAQPPTSQPPSASPATPKHSKPYTYGSPHYPHPPQPVTCYLPNPYLFYSSSSSKKHYSQQPHCPTKN